MKTILPTAAMVAASAILSSAAPDQWQVLAEPPFPYGFSTGGGLATDGSFIYGADFSGDANDDFIDVDDNGIQDPGESLGALGLANGSVRFARYNPATGIWQPLPALEPGFGDDTFSEGNFNGALFAAGGYLYFYQMRSGPNRCVLFRYDLAGAPGGTWLELWNKDIEMARCGPNAGMVGVEAPAGPIILHHRGGGTYEFCRSSALDAGGQHVQLTPDWPYDGGHFPRNGCWEYDAPAGALYHMSGDQLLRWTPSNTYSNACFLTSEPLAGTPLAEFAVAITSLKAALGWDPGGSEPHPGASLWGNSLVVVNDPSGVAGGPAGEDTGAHVVYLVRGETTPEATGSQLLEIQYRQVPQFAMSITSRDPGAIEFPIV